MRISSLKTFFSGLALVSFLSVGGASAQPLVGVNAQLNHTFESKNAAVGQPITARLDGTITAYGTKLERGTELIGKVANVKNDGSTVSVSVVFTSAKLKDGKEIPVKATLLAAFPDQGEEVGADSAGNPPATVNADSVIEQQAGALGHVALTSAVKNQDSGTFSSEKGNFKLQAGTYLQLGLAPAGAGGSMNAAE